MRRRVEGWTDRCGLTRGGVAVRTLTVSAKTRFAPNEKDKDNAPDFWIFAGTAEIGAAWKKQAKETGLRLELVKLDGLSFPASIPHPSRSNLSGLAKRFTSTSTSCPSRLRNWPTRFPSPRPG
jgi:uncharacterized protein (DUF736 family)